MKRKILVLWLILLNSLAACTKIYDDDDEMYSFKAYISQTESIIDRVTHYRSRYVTYEIRYKTAYLTFKALPEIIDLILQEHSHDWHESHRSVWSRKDDFEPIWWPELARLDSLPLWGNEVLYFWYDDLSHTAYALYHND